MTDSKKDSTRLADIKPLPWEARGEPEKTVEENLFDALGSDPEFQDEEDLEDADELESDDDDDLEDEDEDDDDETGDGDDEGEDDEDDAHADDGSEEDEDDEDGEEEDEDSEDTLYEVKIQGKTEEVTLEELQAGYSRTADYTRKRQDDVKEHAVEMEGVRGVRATYGEHLEKLQAVLESLTSADGPDEELRKSDPGEYAAQKQDHADKLLSIQKVADESARVRAEKKKEDDATQAVYLQGEMDKLIAGIDGWDNDATRATEVAKLRDFAMETYGFTAEDLDHAVDHRLLLLLNDNMQFRAKVKKGKKEISRKKKGVRKLKPGISRKSGKGRGKARKANQLSREKLAQTGSVKDAIGAIEGLLGDDD